MSQMTNKLKHAFYCQRRNATKIRQIEWKLSFEEWLDIWKQSGKLNQRGAKKGQYCMSRYNDQGPYAVGNVFIQLHADNLRDAHIGKINSFHTRHKMSIAKKGNKGRTGQSNSLQHKKKISETHIKKIYWPLYIL